MPAPQGYSARTLTDVVDEERINTFADITRDRQWIHVDVARAATESPVGGPVAHGCLSLLAAAVGSAGVAPTDAQGAINYGFDNIRFIAPVPARKRVVASFKLTEVEDKGPKGRLFRLAVALNVEDSDKPALVATRSCW